MGGSSALTISASPLLLPTPAPLTLAGACASSGLFSASARGTFVTTSAHLLGKPEEERAQRSREGEGQQSCGQRCFPVHSTMQGLGNYWDGPGFDPQLLQHQPFLDASGKV